jgi:hypothetical protein
MGMSAVARDTRKGGLPPAPVLASLPGSIISWPARAVNSKYLIDNVA